MVLVKWLVLGYQRRRRTWRFPQAVVTSGFGLFEGFFYQDIAALDALERFTAQSRGRLDPGMKASVELVDDGHRGIEGVSRTTR